MLSNYINSSTPARSYTNLCTSVSSYGRSPMSEGNLMVQPIRSGDHSNGLVSNLNEQLHKLINSSKKLHKLVYFSKQLWKLSNIQGKFDGAAC